MDVNWIVDSPFEALPTGNPDAVAVSLDATETFTYRQLRDRRDEFVQVLRRAGVGHGARVGMLMVNSLDYVALFFALARVGAVAVRLNWRLRPQELEYILNDSGSELVFVNTSRIGQVAPIRDSVAVTAWYSLSDGPDAAPDWAPPVPIVTGVDIDALPRPSGPDPLMLMYTSGTTGRPKGVVWTHEGSMWLANAQAVKWGYTPKTVAMTTGPLYHAGAFESMLMAALLVHGTAVTMSSGGMSTERIVETIVKSSATNVLLYPFLLYDLLRDASVTREQLGSLKGILTGGDPVLPWALEAIDQKFPGVTLEQGYGLTEATMVTCLDHQHRLAHPDSIGRPMPMAAVRVVDLDGRVAGPDEVGEIRVRTPWMTTGYWSLPEATAAAFVDGWLCTGDLGRVTPDGFLVVTGRAKDMIRSGGENIYPAEVEAVLAAHPDVAAVAVVAVPDPKYLEVGAAIVVRAARAPVRGDDLVEQDLRQLARESLAGYKGPRHYVFTDELPMNATGKVQKHLLRSRFSGLGSPVDAAS